MSLPFTTSDYRYLFGIFKLGTGESSQGSEPELLSSSSGGG